MILKTFLLAGLVPLLLPAMARADAPGQAQQAEWTLLIYMNADNNLEPDAFVNFQQLAAVGSTDAVNVVVQFDRIAKYKHTNPEWSQTLRFLVKKGMQPTPANAVEDIGEANMGDGKTLADFVKWGQGRYPARRTMLVIWDHGQGWRLFLQSLLSRRRSLMQSRAPVTTDDVAGLRSAASLLRTGEGKADPGGARAPFRSAPGDPYRSASNDETDNDVLYNRETADALKSSLTRHLDIIGFDACLMSMVEAAYAFRDVADMMVGSEELEPGFGWKYDDWLAGLVATPAVSAKVLSKALVDSYQRTYTNVIQDSETTLSAIDLSQIQTVAASISTLSQLLIDHLDSELQAVIDSRQAVATYAPGYEFHHVDMTQFALELGKRAADANIRAAARDVVTAIRASVVARYAGTEREGIYGSHGLAIYFPSSQYAHVHDPYSEGGYEKANALFPLEFVQQHKWTDFLHAFWSRVP